jgi:hypothetical protein
LRSCRHHCRLPLPQLPFMATAITMVPLLIAPPPLLPFAIFPPQLPSSIVTPVVTAVPIAATVGHCNCAAIPPSIVLLCLSQLCCHCATLHHLLMPPPLNAPTGCKVRLIIITSPLVVPLTFNVPAGCHVASQCTTFLLALAGCPVTLLPRRLSPHLSLHHPFICPGWLLRHPLSCHHLSTHWLVVCSLSLCHPHPHV